MNNNDDDKHVSCVNKLFNLYAYVLRPNINTATKILKKIFACASHLNQIYLPILTFIEPDLSQSSENKCKEEEDT